MTRSKSQIFVAGALSLLGGVMAGHLHGSGNTAHACSKSAFLASVAVVGAAAAGEATLTELPPVGDELISEQDDLLHSSPEIQGTKEPAAASAPTTSTTPARTSRAAGARRSGSLSTACVAP